MSQLNVYDIPPGDELDALIAKELSIRTGNPAPLIAPRYSTNRADANALIGDLQCEVRLLSTQSYQIRADAVYDAVVGTPGTRLSCAEGFTEEHAITIAWYCWSVDERWNKQL